MQCPFGEKINICIFSFFFIKAGLVLCSSCMYLCCQESPITRQELQHIHLGVQGRPCVWQEGAQLWEESPHLPWRRSLAVALCCAPRWAAGRGSQQYSHSPPETSEELNTCHFALNGLIFFIPQRNSYKFIDATKKSSVMAHGEWAPSQLWGKAAPMAEVWFQIWVLEAPSCACPRSIPLEQLCPAFPCTQALGMWARATLCVLRARLLHPSILPLKLLLLLQQEALQATVTLAEVRTGTGRPGAQAGLGERSLHGQPGFQVLPIRLTQSSQARTRLL